MTFRPSGSYPDSRVHGANMGPIWGRQDPGGPHEPCYLGSHYLNQWFLIVNCNFREKLLWYSNQNTLISFMVMHLNISSVEDRPFCLGLNHSSLRSTHETYFRWLIAIPGAMFQDVKEIMNLNSISKLILAVPTLIILFYMRSYNLVWAHKMNQENWNKIHINK